MTSDERCHVVLSFARTLFVNGQATDQTVAAAARLGRALGLRANVMVRWGELQLQSDSEITPFSQVPADPAGVDMDRVAATMRAIEDVETGRLSPGAATKTIDLISRAPPAPTWLFALAAAAGAVALSVIFGVDHFIPTVLIFVSAGAGAILRRALAQLSTNDFIQPFWCRDRTSSTVPWILLAAVSILAPPGWSMPALSWSRSRRDCCLASRFLAPHCQSTRRGERSHYGGTPLPPAWPLLATASSSQRR